MAARYNGAGQSLISGFGAIDNIHVRSTRTRILPAFLEYEYDLLLKICDSPDKRWYANCFFPVHEPHFIDRIKIIEYAYHRTCCAMLQTNLSLEQCKGSPVKKIIRINLKERAYEIREPSGPYRNLGGRGLTASIVAQEVPPDCDPLALQNKLVIAGGILAGTVPNSGRLSIGAKSPLTNTIKETNASGSAAQKLARLGILALVLEGRADGLTTLKIDAKGVTFQSASVLPMVGNLDCIKYYRNRYGDGISIISIGPAGEMGTKAAAVSVTSPDFLPRMSARGGLGAVMGSKNIKAIVIDDAGGSNVTIKDKVLFKASVKAFTEGIAAHPLMEGRKPLLPSMINEIGTICMIDDVDILARLNLRCNDIGVDTMDVGVALAVAMQAGRLPWGDGPKALALVEEIGKGTTEGKMIANGCRYTAEQLGVTRIPHAKGRCPAGYNPRALKGTEMTYAASPMGADHTCSDTCSHPANHLPASSGQTPEPKFLQRFVAAIDTLGMSLFAALPALDNPDLQRHLIDCTGAVLDESLGADYLTHLGEMVLNEERKFNLAAGHRDRDNRMLPFFRKVTLLPGGNMHDFSEEEPNSVQG